MKLYPVSEDQLDNLTNIGWFATTLLSGATGLLGFSINLKSALDLSSGAPNTMISWWSAINMAAFVAALVLYVLGAILFWGGRKQKERIRANTVFNDDDRSASSL